METNRLKQFKSVVDAGGLLRASEILGITPGGLSKSIKTLENELGYSLFHQKGRGLELTEIGQKLYHQLPAALDVFDNLMKLKPNEESKNILKLASFEVFTTYFMGSLILKNYFDRQVEIREAGPGSMEALVSQGLSDFALTYLPIPTPNVEFLKVGKVKMGIYGMKKFKKMSLEQLPFVIPIAPAQGAPSDVRGLDGWPEHLFDRHIQFRVEAMETALQLTRRGLSVVFIPDFVAEISNELHLLEFQLEKMLEPEKFSSIFRDVFLVQRKGAEETKVVRQIAKAVRELK